MKLSALRGFWPDGPTLVAVLVLTVVFVPIVRWVADPPGTVEISITETDVGADNLSRLSDAIDNDRDVVDVASAETFEPEPDLLRGVSVNVSRSVSVSTRAGDELVVDREAHTISVELLVEDPVELEVRGERVTIRKGDPAVVFPLADQPSLFSNAWIALLIAVSMVAVVFTISRPVSRRRDHEERLADMNAIYDR